MARYKSSAFILDAADYRETSKLLHVYCEHEGRISLIARGMRSPKSKKAVLADSFNLVQITYTLKDNATLGLVSGIEGERSYSSLRSRLEAYALASYWFEIIKVAAQERVSTAETFHLTKQLLESLDASTTATPEYRYFLELFQQLGFGAQFAACGDCGAHGAHTRFDLAAGTTVCSSCHNPRRRLVHLPGELVSHLVVLSGSTSSSKPEGATVHAAAFLHFTNQFLALHLDHRFRTFPFLESVYAPAAVPS